MELIISKNLTRESAEELKKGKVLPLRALSRHEKSFLNQHGIRRFYLPSLSAGQRKEFFSLFDRTWNSMCAGFNTNHPFWRNAVSSKMQEWEKSFSYLALTLFTLKACLRDDDRLYVVCKSIEEEEIFISWADLCGWKLMKSPNSFSNTFQTIKQRLKNQILFLRFMVVNLQKKLRAPRFRQPAKTGGESGCILIASLFYPSSFRKGEYQDPFMGKIHRYFEAEGKGCVYIADCVARLDRSLSDRMADCKEAAVNLPHSALSWKDLLKIFFTMYCRRFDLKGIKFAGCDFSALIRRQAYYFDYSFSLNAEMFYEAVKKLCVRYEFDRLLVIYEGNAFERGCIQAFREMTSSKIYGYSHGVIFESNLKLHVTAEEKVLRPEPDSIICTGKHSKDMLSRLRPVNGQDLLDGCSLRFIPQIIKKSQPAAKRILIALDGVYSTASVLDWLIDNKDLFTGYGVSYRTHPNVPIGVIGKYMLNNIPEEFAYSYGALEDDIANSSCVLYRHTSVGIQALLNGVPAVHLAIDSPLPVDPIEDLSKGRWIVKGREDLQKVLSEIAAPKKSRVNEGLKEALRFTKDYFSPPTQERMNQLTG